MTQKVVTVTGAYHNLHPNIIFAPTNPMLFTMASTGMTLQQQIDIYQAHMRLCAFQQPAPTFDTMEVKRLWKFHVSKAIILIVL